MNDRTVWVLGGFQAFTILFPDQNKFLDWAGIKPLKNEDITKWRVLFRRERQGKGKGWVKTSIQQVTGSSKA